MLQAQQRLSGEPEKNSSECWCAREHLFQRGILCFCTRLALGNGAASFPPVPASALQPVETQVGAVQCSRDASFRILGVVTANSPRDPSQALGLWRLWRAGQTNVPQMALWRWDGIRWPLTFFFHPVFCSSAICLLRNRWCQFQILNSLGWMNPLDEMLFLNPAPYLPAFFFSFFVNTAYYQLGRQSTGTRESSWWRQLWCGCNCFRGGDTGQKSGFGLNHYKWGD